MPTTIEDLDKRLTAVEETLADVRVIRKGRPPVIGECKFGLGDACVPKNKASVYQYQHGCHGQACSDENARYYAEHRDKKKAEKGAAPSKKVAAPRKKAAAPAAKAATPAPAKKAAPKAPAAKKTVAPKQPVEPKAPTKAVAAAPKAAPTKAAAPKTRSAAKTKATVTV